MKRLLIFLVILLIPLCSCKKDSSEKSSGDKKKLSLQTSGLIEVKPSEADEYTGEEVIVTGKVADIFTSKKGNTFINFDRKYPNHTFTAVKFDNSKVNISGIKPGCTLSIKGTIKIYNGKPEIILNSQEQILEIN